MCCSFRNLSLDLQTSDCSPGRDVSVPSHLISVFCHHFSLLNQNIEMSGDAKTRPDYNLQSNLRPEILLSSDDNDIDKVMSISVQHKVGAITIFAGAHQS